MSVVPDASKDLLQRLPGVKTLEVTAKYPIAEGECWSNCNYTIFKEYGNMVFCISIRTEKFNIIICCEYLGTWGRLYERWI